jgi:SET domain-containing protein
MADVIVKKSQIHGLGVFASRNFKKGEVIIRWDISRKLTKKEVDILPEEEKRYIVYLDGEYILMQHPARYVNHSCDANTYVNNFCDVAKRDIKKGEEITANYSETMAPGESMECKCGSKNCRRIIKAYSKAPERLK